MSSSPVAVAAPDPEAEAGHGGPKQQLQPEATLDAAADGKGSLGASSGPAEDDDVTMTEAPEEVTVVAEVKEDGTPAVAGDAAVTSDVVLEGGDAASVIDPLYATESAGMVSVEGDGDEAVDEARGLAEPEGMQGEEDSKLVSAGDVAVEVMEAPGSTEHAEAESNELEENYEMSTPVVESTGNHNGVPHCDDEIQCARYRLPPLEKDGFRVCDLVWGKVKSHPWWPGEIFDPSDASELALKHQKKGNQLVAYFGDNTFAWCDESQLKPFVSNYSQMEKQSSSDAFVGSVNYALEELSRRILSGMSCSCLPEELADNGMSYMVENAGLKDGVTCSEVKRSEILTCFSPENLLRYVQSLALFPGQGGDLLELVIACSQLTSFYRSKGCPELASFQTADGWAEDGMDTSSGKNIMVEEAVVNEVPPSNDKPKRGRGRPRKQKPEDDAVLKDKKARSNLSSDTANGVSVKRQMAMDFDDFDDLQSKKKRSLDSLEDSETKSSTPTGGSSFKIGECIRRAASQLTGSSSIVKSQNELTVHKNAAEAENGEFDISSDDALNEPTVEKRAKTRRVQRHHIADPKELFSQLCSVATEPMNGYSTALIISYFSDYRNYVVSTTTEANVVEKSATKRGRKRRVLPSPEQETTDHMQDSYWSGLSLHNHPIHNLKRGSISTRPRCRRRSSQEADVPSVLQTPKKPIQVIERSIIHVDEKIVDECKPTALVLSFGMSTALPSEANLIKMFGRYGPLKVSETEVQKNTNTVKVVFKKRADAERAFSVAGKYGTFGPSLRSYRLVNMPFSLDLSEADNPQQARHEDHGLKAPGPVESVVPLDTMQIDQVDNTDKDATVKESSGEHVETAKQTCEAAAVEESSGAQVEPVKQTCDAEAAYKPLVDQVGMVEKTGQIDAELTGRSDQNGEAVHSGQAVTVAEESSEQASTIEQACGQDEASLENRPEITLSGAATEASNGGAVDEIQLEKASNQALVEVPSNTLQTEAVSDARTEDIIHESAEAMKEFSAVISDTSQVDVVPEASKQGHVCGDNDVSESSVVAQVNTVEQIVQEASAEVAASTTQAATSHEALQGGHVLSDALHTEEAAQEVGVIEQAREDHLNKYTRDMTEADSNDDNKVSEEAACKESVEQDGTNAEADTVKDLTKASAEQVCSLGLTEAPGGGQIGVGEQSAEDVAMAVESETRGPVEESVECKAAAETLPGETAEGNSAVDAPDDKMETEITAEAPSGDNMEVETAAKGPDDNMENKATAEAPSEDNMEVESTSDVPDEKLDGAPKALAGETTEGQTTAGAPDAQTSTSEKAVEITTVETPDEKIAVAIEDPTLEAPDEKTTSVKKAAEDSTVEAPDGKTTSVKKAEDATVQAPNEVVTTAIASVTVEAPDEIATATDKTVDGVTTEAPAEMSTAAQKKVEDATIEAPHEKAATAEESAADSTVQAPDGQESVAE